MLAFLYYLNLRIKVRTLHVTYFGSKYPVKYKFISKFIQLGTITNLFSFEVAQKCQLSALRESSNLSARFSGQPTTG